MCVLGHAGLSVCGIGVGSGEAGGARRCVVVGDGRGDAEVEGSVTWETVGGTDGERTGSVGVHSMGVGGQRGGQHWDMDGRHLAVCHSRGMVLADGAGDEVGVRLLVLLPPLLLLLLLLEGRQAVRGVGG